MKTCLLLKNLYLGIRLKVTQLAFNVGKCFTFLLLNLKMKKLKGDYIAQKNVKTKAKKANQLGTQILKGGSTKNTIKRVLGVLSIPLGEFSGGVSKNTWLSTIGLEKPLASLVNVKFVGKNLVVKKYNGQIKANSIRRKLATG